MKCSGVTNGCICGQCTAKDDAAVKTWLNGGAFALTNTPPKPAKVPLGNVGNSGVQKMLLTGLDCLPGQMDLFNTDATNGETR